MIPPDAIDFNKISVRKLEISDDFSDFKCDKDDDRGCDEFIHKENEAKLYQKEKFGITYLFFYESVMLGYVTLAMSSIPAQRMARKFRKEVHLQFYPSLLVGRLAVANGWRAKGIGDYLCKWGVGVARSMSERIGCRYVILNTSEGKKTNYYGKRGFQVGKKVEGDKEGLVWMYLRLVVD